MPQHHKKEFCAARIFPFLKKKAISSASCIKPGHKPHLRGSIFHPLFYLPIKLNCVAPYCFVINHCQGNASLLLSHAQSHCINEALKNFVYYRHLNELKNQLL